MNYNYSQILVSEFDTNALPGFHRPKKWHLTFLEPEIFNGSAGFTRVSKCVNGTDITIEYAIVTILRPWMNYNIFEIPFSHKMFKGGGISDGNGKGYMAEINSGMILARYIKIGTVYESNQLEIIGWIVEKVPYCPAD